MIYDYLNDSRYSIEYTTTTSFSVNPSHFQDLLKTKIKYFNDKKCKTFKDLLYQLYGFAVISETTYTALKDKNVTSLTLKDSKNNIVEPILKDEEGNFYIDLDVFYSALDIKDIEAEELEIEPLSL